MSPTLIYTPLNNKVLELGLWKENKSSYQHHHHTLLKRIWCEWANWHSNFPSNATSSPLPRFSKFLYLLSSQITYQVTAQEGICILTKKSKFRKEPLYLIQKLFLIFTQYCILINHQCYLSPLLETS